MCRLRILISVVIAVLLVIPESTARSQTIRTLTGRIRESVTLDTDSAVVKKFGTIRAYLDDQQWAQAINFLQQTTDTHGDLLIDVSPGRYVNVGLYCNMLLSGLPPEGLRIYRQRIDPQARKWFAAGKSNHDETQLLKVVRLAFASSYGDDALWLLAERAWERGRFSTARNYWERLLPPPRQPPPGESLPVLRYPDTNLAHPAAWSRLVLCSLFERDTGRARAELQRLKQVFPDAEGTLAGRTGKLAEIVEDIVDSAKSWPVQKPDGGVSTFAFNAERNSTLPRPVDVAAVQWSVRLARDRFQSFKPRPALNDRGPLSYFPVVFGDIVLVNDADAIHAYDLRTGKPYFQTVDDAGAKAVAVDDGNSARNVDEPKGDAERKATDRDLKNAVVYSTIVDDKVTPNQPVVGIPRYTMTVHEGRVYARMGAPVTNKASGEFKAHSEIIGLDLVNGQGKAVWHVMADNIEPKDAVWSFEGSPLVAGGRLYVALNRSRPSTQSHVACFDIETQKLIWNRKVCARVAGGNDSVNFASHQLLTFAENTLFYATGLGAVAALNPDDGTLRWVRTYEVGKREDNFALSDHSKFGLTPCLHHRGTVIFVPAGTDRVIAVAAESGVLQWERRLGDRIRHLLGVDHGQLIVSGNSLWGLNLRTGAVTWRSLVNNDDPASHGYGRGLLVGDTVWWPTREQIVVVSQRTGKRLREPILLRPRGATGGNLVIANGYLLITEPDRLVAFSEQPGQLQRRLQDEVSANPKAALPHFRLAQIAESAGDLKLAMQHAERADALAVPSDRIYGRMLKQVLAEKLFELLSTSVDQALATGDLGLASRKLARSISFAPSNAALLSTFVRLASVYTENDRPNDAVETYQVLLSQPDLATLPIGGAGGITARTLARQQIDKLIKRHGRTVYSQYDAAAQLQIYHAIRSENLERLHAVFSKYPNSVQIAPGRLQLARWHRVRGDPVAALDACERSLVVQSFASVRRSALIESAQLSEELRYWRIAGDRWRQWAREFPDATISHEGGKVAATSFVADRLRQPHFQRELSSNREPQLPLPLVRRWTRSLSNTASVVIPDGAAPSRQLQCVLVNHDGVDCLNRADGTTRWSTVLESPVSWTAYSGHLLLLATRKQLRAVTHNSGKLVWHTSLADATDSATSVEVEPAAKRPKLETKNAFRSFDDFVCVFRPGRAIVCFNTIDGSVRWRFRPPAGRLGRHWYCDRQIIVVQSFAPNSTWILNSVSGRTAVANRPTSNRGGDESDWFAAPVRIGSQRIGIVTSQRQLRTLSLSKLQMRWTYSGPVSHANADPDLLANGDQLLLVIDGDTLVQPLTGNGRSPWSTGLGSVPLLRPREAIALDKQHAYAAADGILRSFRLDNGKLSWEQYVGHRDRSWRAVNAGEFVVCYPRVQSQNPQPADVHFPLIVCDARNGRFVQKLRLKGSYSKPQVDLDADTVLVVLGNRMYGLSQL